MQGFVVRDGKRARPGVNRKSGPELLSHLGAVLAEQLKKKGLESPAASEITLDIMEYLRVEFGGQSVYFPQGSNKKMEEKAAEIYDKYSEGTEIYELAHLYEHSIQWIYRLIGNERVRRREERNQERALSEQSQMHTTNKGASK